MRTNGCRWAALAAVMLLGAGCAATNPGTVREAPPPAPPLWGHWAGHVVTLDASDLEGMETLGVAEVLQRRVPGLYATAGGGVRVRHAGRY